MPGRDQARLRRFGEFMVWSLESFCDEWRLAELLKRRTGTHVFEGATAFKDRAAAAWSLIEGHGLADVGSGVGKLTFASLCTRIYGVTGRQLTMDTRWNIRAESA